MASTDQPTTPDLDDDVLDDSEPCGENSCYCQCGEHHVCGCDCVRCAYCQQLAENCQCDDEEL